jgi:Zn-dependent protease/predicted transcriptional regulator
MAEAAAENKRGFKLMTLRGIEIRIDYSWFVVFALVLLSLSAGYFPQAYPDQPVHVYWLTGFFATLLFFLSVITHELAHSLMAIRSGIKIPEITLFIFGGMARLSEDARDPKTEFKIAIVGPLTSFALAAVFGLPQHVLRGNQPSILVELFGYLSWINVALGIFNLLPGYPLDGGRVLRAIWWWKTGSVVEATRVSSDWGKGLAIVLMVLGGLQIFSGNLIGGVWIILIGLFLRGLAEASYQDVAMRKTIEGARANDVMIRDVVTASTDMPLKRAISDRFLRYGYRGFPVTEDDRVLGLISLANVKGMSEDEQEKKTVGQVMEPLNSEMTIQEDTPVSEALRRSARNRSSHFLVMRDGRMVGMVTYTGMLRYMEVRRALA